MTVAAGLLIAVLLAAGAAIACYARFVLPRQLEARFAESMQAFSMAVELRFPSHRGMTERVVRLSSAVAREMALDRETVRRLRSAAHLRDVGLCSMSFQLGNGKAPMEWTEAETATYDRHPEVGGAMLELVPSLRRLANIVRCHHACYDGSSGTFFPAGEDIPIESRVLNVVSSFVWDERMTGAVLAYDALVERSGKAFDPVVVSAFRSVLRSTRVAEDKPLAAARS